MFFFQVTLLAGYCYAHVTTTYLPRRIQCVLHIVLVVIAVAWLPIYPSVDWKPTGTEENPTWQVLGLLGHTLGVQFLLLSTTAPLTQVWWQRVSQRAPYWLYAVSNAGSLLALVTYPFFVEPILGTRHQAFVWSVGFSILAVLIMGCGFLVWRTKTTLEPVDDVAEAPPPTWKSYAAWMGLSGCGSVLLLAMTNHISQNVAVVPFLWVAPLALYLLSFILTFGDVRFYRRDVFGGLMMVTLTACAFLYNFNVIYDVVFLLAIHLTALLAGCMICHGELVRLKPAARHLTTFYVTISAGGAAGGFLVSLAAPVIFLQYYEYPLVLIACWLILIVITLRDERLHLYRGRPLWVWARILFMWALILIMFPYFLAYLRNGVIKDAAIAILTRRNFYGVLTVQRARSDQAGYEWAELKHGMIRHGAQYLDADKQHEPTTYYARTSGLGYVMDHLADKPKKRVGMLGLGIGTIAAYCQQGDSFRAYEINRDVIQIATNPDIFTYWTLFEERGATAEIIEGDARISLERELSLGQPQNFDVLVLDVFTGDAIPVHLLTREAFGIYFQHLAPDGILAVHISNRHLDLLPVVRAMAQHYDVDTALVSDPQVSEWVLVGHPRVLGEIARKNEGKVQRLRRFGGDTVMWTDDYSNIFSVLK